MKRYRKISTDRTPVTDGEIGNLKPPFEELVEGVKGVGPALRRPPLRKILLTAAAAAVIIAAIVGYVLLFHQGPQSGEEQPAPLQLAEAFDKEGISPPDPSRIQYEYFVVKQGSPAVFTTGKGSKIRVPSSSFAHKDGRPCREEVVLRYSEFHNPLEIFLSGVPMGYDSAGVQFTFESAGMFDIRAFSGGEDLMLADGKEILVDLVSDASEPFNIYHYDTLSDRWKYIATEMRKDISLLKSAGDGGGVVPGSQASSGAALMTPDLPAGMIPENLPQKRDKTKYAFKIDFDEKLYPELTGIRNLLFEVADSTADTKFLRGTWDSLSLAGNQETGYSITLFRLKKSYTFDAKPVLNAGDYDAAVEQYRLARAQKEEEGKKRRESAVSQKKVMETGNSQVVSWAYARRVAVVNLGTWNCDRPVPMPVSPVPFFAGFTDEQGNPLNPSSIFVAQESTNILWTYKPHQRTYYSGTKRNIMWFLLPDGRYALVTDEQLRKPDRVLVPRIAGADEAFTMIGAYI